MFNFSPIKFLAFLVLTILAARSFASPVSTLEAMWKVSGWSANGRHFGSHKPGAPNGQIETFSKDGTNLFHLVALENGGFVAVGPDDSRPLIMAYSPSGDISSVDEKSPLFALLCGDGARSAGFKNPRNIIQSRNTIKTSSSHPYIARGTRLAAKVLSAASSGLSSVSDVRVEPFIKSKWNQKQVANRNCYNYYTPDHVYCGCVATAMAQIMRYYKYPTQEIEPQTFLCYKYLYTLNDEDYYEELDLPMKGGTYSWDSMPLVPSSSSTADQFKEIGKICYDAGVSVRMQYGSGGSGAFGGFIYEPLVDVFGFANAKSIMTLNDFESLTQTQIEKSILANLDASCPVMLGIVSETQWAGHAVLADGYGYEDGTLWCHLNMGWSGQNDLWYALPNIPAGSWNFSVVNTVIYNVFPRDTGELVTGRVTDEDGNAVSNAIVSATYLYNSNKVTTNVTTSATGIYSVLIPAPTGEDPVRNVKLVSSYGKDISDVVTTSVAESTVPDSIDWEYGDCDFPSRVIGNSWGNDLVVKSLDVATPQISSFATSESQSGAEGEAREFSFAFDATPGAKYVVEWKSALTNETWNVWTNILIDATGSALLDFYSPAADSMFIRVKPE